MTASSRSWAVKQPCLSAEVCIHGRQFSKDHSNAVGKTFLQSLNPNSLKVVTAYFDRHCPPRNRNGSFSLVSLATFWWIGGTLCDNKAGV